MCTNIILNFLISSESYGKLVEVFNNVQSTSFTWFQDISELVHYILETATGMIIH